MHIIAQEAAALQKLLCQNQCANELKPHLTCQCANAPANLLWLADLDVSHNCLTHQSCEALGVVLWARKAASRPKADQVTAEGGLCVRVMRQPGVLTSLSLEGNSIGDRGASALCTALARPCSLTSLNLQACSLTEKSCVSLCALLQVTACTP